MKNFKSWHDKKEILESNDKVPFFHEMEIWFAYLGVNLGYEQDGSDNFLRPILIFKKFNNNIFLGIPLTRKFKDNKFHYKIEKTEDGKVSAVILSQIKLVDAKRLSHKIGKLNKEEFGRIKEKLRTLMF